MFFAFCLFSFFQDGNKKLFEWCDGPLVLAMKQGNPFLIDEISLADDSVLERLNSVLEPEQKLLLAERGSGENQDDVEEVVAKDGFHITATMNPGGDYGKKEVSSTGCGKKLQKLFLHHCRLYSWKVTVSLKSGTRALITHGRDTEGVKRLMR